MSSNETVPISNNSTSSTSSVPYIVRQTFTENLGANLGFIFGYLGLIGILVAFLGIV
jgi:hypothetical protein